MRALDLTGVRFGRLTATELVRVNGVRGWLCVCDCGNTVELETERLRMGTTRSCGCIRREMAAKLWRFAPPNPGTHGLSELPEYAVWSAMRQRCINPSDKSFKWYGARGIVVCTRWLVSFEAFIADMGRRPTRKHSIDRIDNDGNYEPGNCRWTTASVQANNKRKPSRP
jgi:hypothetical protein